MHKIKKIYYFGECGEQRPKTVKMGKFKEKVKISSKLKKFWGIQNTFTKAVSNRKCKKEN